MSSVPAALIPDHLKSKIVYIDHIKVLLTVLVVMHHTFITYGAPGGWYYTQKTVLLGALIPMTMFVAVNQSFFMGFFFFLSALFIPSSYEKKGFVKFVTDRMIRLGLPLAFYSFILSPILSYIVYRFADNNRITYLQYLTGFHPWVDFGVLWFVAALLLFTLIYAFYRLIFIKQQSINPLPSTSAILIFAISIGAVSYLVRIIFPVGWVLKPLGFQLGHFTQYIVLFILGLMAFKNKWINQLDYRIGKKMVIIALFMIFIGFPAFFIAQKILDFPVDRFNIGGHWQSLWYAVWEQLTGFSIITALLYVSKQWWNRPSVFLNILSRSAFAVYIFHPLILISLSVALNNWQIDPAIKLLVVTPLTVIFSFLFGWIIVNIPGVNSVI